MSSDAQTIIGKTLARPGLSEATQMGGARVRYIPGWKMDLEEWDPESKIDVVIDNNALVNPIVRERTE